MRSDLHSVHLKMLASKVLQMVYWPSIYLVELMREEWPVSTLHLIHKEANSRVATGTRSKLFLPGYTQTICLILLSTSEDSNWNCDILLSSFCWMQMNSIQKVYQDHTLCNIARCLEVYFGKRLNLPLNCFLLILLICQHAVAERCLCSRHVAEMMLEQRVFAYCNT